MATEKQSEDQPLKEREGKLSLEKSTEQLVKYGGFDLLETVIEGVSNLNPSRKARKNIFLTEDAKKEERKQLKKRLELWKEILSSTDNLGEMAQSSQDKVDRSKEVLSENVSKAVEACKDLERSYRSMALFFKNTELDKVKNVSIVNAEMDNLTDLDNTVFFDEISREIESGYDRLDLRDNYSMMVMPGYLGSNSVISKWAQMAHKNKVMMVTDFRHLDTAEDVIDVFDSANHAGGDAYLSNVIMTSNWLVGRGKYDDIGEEDDMYVPPAAALAGKIYSTLASQVTAGRKHGTLNEVDGVKFQTKKSDIAQMEKMGLVPMVSEYGKIMAFSAKTLFNGDNVGLQTYSVVRVFDWVIKVLMDFLNRRAFENWDHNMRMDIQSQIVRFLDKITGPGKLIEKFTIKKFERDPTQKDRIILDIHMVPYFPAKTFLISLDGTKGDDAEGETGDRKWDSAYNQQV